MRFFSPKFARSCVQNSKSQKSTHLFGPFRLEPAYKSPNPKKVRSFLAKVTPNLRTNLQIRKKYAAFPPKSLQTCVQISKSEKSTQLSRQIRPKPAYKSPNSKKVRSFPAKSAPNLRTNLQIRYFYAIKAVIRARRRSILQGEGPAARIFTKCGPRFRDPLRRLVTATAHRDPVAPAVRTGVGLACGAIMAPSHMRESIHQLRAYPMAFPEFRKS